MFRQLCQRKVSSDLTRIRSLGWLSDRNLHLTFVERMSYRQRRAWGDPRRIVHINLPVQSKVHGHRLINCKSLWWVSMCWKIFFLCVFKRAGDKFCTKFVIGKAIFLVPSDIFSHVILILILVMSWKLSVWVWVFDGLLKKCECLGEWMSIRICEYVKCEHVVYLHTCACTVRNSSIAKQHSIIISSWLSRLRL